MTNSAIKFTRFDTKCIKCVAIVLMIIHHAFLRGGVNIYYFSNMEMKLCNILQRSGKLCVGLFLMLSGYGMYFQLKNCQDNLHKEKVINRKVIGGYRKYWISLGVFLPIMLCQGLKTNFMELILNALCIKITYNHEVWFLRTFAICTILAPWLIKFIDSQKMFLQELLVIVTIDVIGRLILLNGIRGLDILSSYNSSNYAAWMRELELFISSYLTGLALAKRDIFSIFKRKVIEYKKAVIYPVSLLIIGMVLYIQFYFYDQYMYITSVIFSFGIIGLFAYDNKFKKTVIKCGKYSTYMWLTHTYFAYYCFSNITYAPKYPGLIVIINFIMSLFTAVLLEHLENVIIRKFNTIISYLKIDSFLK